MGSTAEYGAGMLTGVSRVIARRARLLRVLIVLGSVLVVVAGLTAEMLDEYAGGWAGVRGRLDLAAEHNVPTAWSSVLYLLAAGLCLLLGRAAATRERGDRWWWFGLGAVLAAMGSDEWLALHERTIEPVRDALHVSGLLLYAWVIPGFVVFVGLCLLFAGFVKRLPIALRRSLYLGVALIAVGAIGMEMVGGWWAERYGTGPGWVLVYTLEETLEFAGTTTIVVGLLAHLAVVARSPAPATVSRRATGGAEQREVANGTGGAQTDAGAPNAGMMSRP